MPRADTVTFDLKTMLVIIGAVVGIAGSFGVAAYRISQLEKQVERSETAVRALERSQVELTTALRVKGVIQ
jgi:hypothetical protein